MTYLRKLYHVTSSARSSWRYLALGWLFGFLISSSVIALLRGLPIADYAESTTNMSQDYPPLALDDLVHLMSPSPTPQALLDDSDIAPRTESASPESLPESDIIQMRRKVVEMRHIDKDDAQLTPREKELAEMVLRLTAVVRQDPNQLLRQADMISALTQQRDLLLHQAEEQRLRWNSEKDGWARMAEALLAQQAKSRLNTERDEDFERIQATDTDNKSLRQRLNETQSRLQTLESELTRLRPLLLMQPLISRSSMLPPTPIPKTQYTRRRKKDSVATEDEEHGASEDEVFIDPLDTPSHTSQSQATPRAKSRKSEVLNSVHHPLTNPHKRRPSQKATSRVLSADARAEHLLLAARKIGKHRAGIMSGMVQHLEERERERRREDSATTAVATTPKTPKRNTSHTGYPPEGYLYLNGQMRPGPGMQPVPLFIPAYPHHVLQTPSSSTTAPSVTSSAQKPKQDARTNNPPTPLDSLLSAARSMMREDIGVEVDEDEEVDVVGDSPGKTAGTRHARSRDMLGSPVPKRRKVAARTDKLTALHELTSRATGNVPASSVNTSGVTNANAGRVRSALDVLADQAAAFSTQEQSVAPFETQIRTQTEGKGKEKADTQSREPSSSTHKSRGRTKSRRKEPEVDTPSSIAPTTRSRTPQSDSGDNLTGSTRVTQPPVGGSASEAPVDPGGGTSSASTSNSSSQTLDSTSVPEGNQVITNNDVRSPRLPDTALHADDSVDVTPRQGSRIQGMPGEERLDGMHAAIAQPNLAHLLPPSIPENEPREASPPLQHSETTPSGDENDGIPGSGSTASAAPAKNKELVRVAEQDVPVPAPPMKRQRSPYVKWSKEEDDLLAQAVAKYGQKWDLVQKALPSRGYHQVRQRWLRKLGKSPFRGVWWCTRPPKTLCSLTHVVAGVFDSKPDLSSFQTAATIFPSTSRDGVEPRGNPKLGLAPLSSERAFSGLVGRPPSLPS
ncbi:hypothetical protein J3R83DRAFT_1406 [Lanmaoa asiatica]|nr:hypothetical protein J3R83DRAFT_1406 [Lanmaoa asiatica]